MAGVLIGVVVGWLSAPGRTAGTLSFEATHSLLVDTQAYATSLVEQAALRATKGAVPDRVAARLGLDPQFVRSAVSTETPPNKGLLLITGRSHDRAQAEALANVTAEELLVELGGAKAQLRTLEQAVASPVKTDDFQGPTSHAGRALLLGGFGLLLGVAAAFAVERVDNRIRTKDGVEQALGGPVLAEVPPVPRSARDGLLTPTHSSLAIEAYRGLRTSVARWASRTDGSEDHRVILVTSATGAEGKTTTVAHLAATLAEVGHSVMVISADLRHPRLHLYFDRPSEPGLSDLLGGAPDVRRLADLNLTAAIRGVQFVASGAPVRNPGPLLDHIGDHLRDARRVADFVLVDSPPLLVASDAAQLARHADGVLFVVRAGRTSVGAAVRSAEQLELLGIPVLGAVLVASDAARTTSRSPRPRHRTRPGRRTGASSASKVGEGTPSH